MTNPKILRATFDAQAGVLTLAVERDVTDAFNNVTTRQQFDVTGPLASFPGIVALRTAVVAWGKAQTGYAGVVDIA
jgi:hypothetical protein